MINDTQNPYNFSVDTLKYLLFQAEKQQQQVDKSIQEATFVISNPLPAITLNVTKQTYNYSICYFYGYVK